MPPAAGPCSPARPGRRSPPPPTATWTPPPTPSRSPPGSAGTRTGTWPSPPAPPDPTSWTSTTTAPPGTGTPRSPGCPRPACWTARPDSCAPPAGDCTPTSPARPSATATCPPITWTSGPAAATSWPRPPASTASRTRSSGRCNADGALNWATVTALLEPHRQPRRPQPGPDPGRGLGYLARWVAGQAEGNRNAGLFWAANRALDADPAADLSPLAAAARQAGLGDREITRTLDSARNGGRTRTYAPDYQPEAGDHA